MKYLVTALLLSGLSLAFSQKANLETANALFSQGKYMEAYQLIHADNFKYKDDERNAYNLLLARTCYAIYVTTPEINSAYRNEGINRANDVGGADKGAATEILVYLTSTIYNDMLPSMREVTDTTTLIFRKFTPETLLAFRYFVIPAEWTPEDLSGVASHFYYDAAYISNMPEASNDDFDGNLRTRYYACKKIAARFYELLCNTHQQECDTYNIIK